MGSRRSRLASLLLLGALAGGTMIAAGIPAAAQTVGTTEGCTPGYWKNHTEDWQEYSPTQTVASVFSAAADTPYGTLTLLAALNLQGGSGVSGAQQILLRAAVAALLNSAYDPLAFPWQREGSQYRPSLIETVNSALESGTRSTMLSLANWLDQDNRLGCPLS